MLQRSESLWREKRHEDQRCKSIVSRSGISSAKAGAIPRAHNALLCEIESVIAIDTAESIDELTCILDERNRRDPEGLAHQIKETIKLNVGVFITSSIGFAANR